MMDDMTKKYFHQIIDELHLVLVVDVHEGVDDKKNLGKVVIGGCTTNFKGLLLLPKNTPPI